MIARRSVFTFCRVLFQVPAYSRNLHGTPLTHLQHPLLQFPRIKSHLFVGAAGDVGEEQARVYL